MLKSLWEKNAIEPDTPWGTYYLRAVQRLKCRNRAKRASSPRWDMIAAKGNAYFRVRGDLYLFLFDQKTFRMESIIIIEIRKSQVMAKMWRSVWTSKDQGLYAEDHKPSIRTEYFTSRCYFGV